MPMTSASTPVFQARSETGDGPLWRALDALDKAGELNADIVLPAAAFDRVVELIENPPAPSTKMRQLLRRGPP